ncbi:MAG TPA: acyl-CoA thioesterase domain-containing protein [Candidatus Nanopelagicales bacterium]
MEHLDLAALVRPTPTEHPARFTLDVPDGLQQGRGAWGGLATGAMVSAARQFDGRPALLARTLGAQLVAPVLVGEVVLEVESLRRGSRTHTLDVRMRDAQGGLLAHGVVVLGAARGSGDVPDGAAWQRVAPPNELAGGPEAVPVLPVGPPLAPDFTVHLEFRIVAGIPFQGSTSDVVCGWIAPRGPLSAVDDSVVAALADAWWVAVMPQLDRPRPVATLGFSLELPLDPARLPRTADGGLQPLFHRGRTIAAREGYVVEVRELWTGDGRLASWNTQTVTIIA